jgi:glycerophosphoryl diester phosphodiesterase
MDDYTWKSIIRREPHVRPLIMAHRGSSDEAPENTLTSFRLALSQGADILETDLRFTRDGEIVLMHDATVDRTTNGSGKVSEMTLTEIKELRHQPLSLPKGEGERAEAPATLEELLQCTRGKTPLALELKDDRFLNSHGASSLLDLLAKNSALESTALVSFSYLRLQTFRPLAPRLPIGMITLSNPFPIFPTEFLGPFFPLLYANPLYVWWARRLGKIVCPLDPAPEPRLSYYVRHGVSVLLSNHPARTLRALSRWYSA